MRFPHFIIAVALIDIVPIVDDACVAQGQVHSCFIADEFL